MVRCLVLYKFVIELYFDVSVEKYWEQLFDIAESNGWVNYGAKVNLEEKEHLK